jgi:DEAD/DEAH box helicase domain-containing protein
VAILQSDDIYRSNVEHIEVLSAREPIFGEVNDVEPRVDAFLKHKGIRLYRHQIDARTVLRASKNIVITTPTASGKTLAFNVPIFEELDCERSATALYLFPTKALSNDQLRVLEELELISGIPVSPRVYDGDTPSHKRPKIRTTSRIVISNPYELHHVLLWHYKWQRFLAHLKFIVLDEAHVYRGVFGSNVALLVRRLRRLCAHYGATPQFVISTATLANPVEFAERLTGVSYDLIAHDGSPRGRKFFVLYNPYANAIRAPVASREASNLFLLCIREKLQTLCFTPSRKLAELVALWARNTLEDSAPALVDRIAAYRAGYLPAKRREIEARLKSGDLIGITSTNALELGMDIGSLDAVVMAGYPGTIISTMQQAGRAGRGESESIATLIGLHNPLDQYLMKHPEALFGGSHENAIIALSNEYITAGHVMCAAAELPLRLPDDEAYFPALLVESLHELQQHGLTKETAGGWVYSGRGRATEAVPLNALSPNVFKMVCEGRLLETLDTIRAYREAHQGAVVLHDGETYIVKQLNLSSGVISVSKMDVDFHTEPIKTVDLHIIKELETQQKGSLSVSFGTVEVVEQYVGYKTLRHDQVVGIEGLDLPPLRFTTTALWFTVPDTAITRCVSQDFDVAGSIHGAEHALIAVMPLHVMCDRWDIGGVSTVCHADTGRPTVFIYDAFEGGIGLAEKATELIAEVVRMARGLVRGCSCDIGCPACIYSPKCGNDNRPLDKKGTIILLDELAQRIATATPTLAFKAQFVS